MQRWYDAINTSMTFLDAAIKDAIIQCSQVKEASPWDRRIIFYNAPPIELQNYGLKDKDMTNPLQFRVHVAGHESERACAPTLGNTSAGDRPPKSPTTLRDWPGEGKPSLADYRNFNTHKVTVDESGPECPSGLYGTGLWAAALADPVTAANLLPGQAFSPPCQLSHKCCNTCSE